MNKVRKAWVAPFPTGNGQNSGTVYLCFRVPLDEHPPRLERMTSLMDRKDPGQGMEYHFKLGLLDENGLRAVRDAITDYLEGDDHGRGFEG